MRRFLPLFVALALAIAPLAANPAPVPAADCQFVLGFLTLQKMIPNIVRSCLENVRNDGVTGDGLQATTNGLLVWRKADNFTAFTDGFRSWINGPFGLQQRLNSQRFFWESNPEGLEIVPPPVAGDQCHTAQLSLTAGEGNAATGHAGVTLTFTNNAAVSCTIFGYVGAQMLDAQNNSVPTQVIRGDGFLFPDPGALLVTLPSGGSADFGLEWGNVPVGNETVCPAATQLAVIPPNEFAPIIVPLQLAPCGAGTIHVTAVQPST